MLKEPELTAAVGMGFMTTNILGVSFFMGINSVLDTLVSQAAGAGNLELCGVLNNRA